MTGTDWLEQPLQVICLSVAPMSPAAFQRIGSMFPIRHTSDFQSLKSIAMEVASLPNPNAQAGM